MATLSAVVLRFSVGLTLALGLGQASFEVASIKPAVPDAFGSSGEDGRNGFLKVYNVSLRRCIKYAYRIPETQILGGMLQPLLADRFKLALHHESRPISGYVLTAVKGGIRANVSTSPSSGADGGRGSIDTVGTPVSELVNRLSELLQCPVVDKTRFGGLFDPVKTNAACVVAVHGEAADAAA